MRLQRHIPLSAALIKSLFIAIFLVCVVCGDGWAQQTNAPKKATSNIFEAKVRAANATTLVSGKTRIHLWGVQNVESAGAAFQLRVRTILDNAIGTKAIQCEMKKRKGNDIHAQCVNAGDLDLSLFLLQQGFVTVDRSAVYGTVFEEAYIQAETESQSRNLGVWQDPNQRQGAGGDTDSNLMLSFGFILFLCVIAAFTVLSIIIMRGFQKVIDAQNENIEMMTRERKLRDKERKIIAMMLDSELKANKSKIEAYLLVYDEMLKALKDPDRPPKYKKSGDIVQMQPALDRVVFDRNTDKMDVLGKELSSQIVHFYARIKSKPVYENLEPDMDLPNAVKLVEGALEGAQRLDQLSEILITAFDEGGLASSYAEVLEEDH